MSSGSTLVQVVVRGISCIIGVNIFGIFKIFIKTRWKLMSVPVVYQFERLMLIDVQGCCPLLVGQEDLVIAEHFQCFPHTYLRKTQSSQYGFVSFEELLGEIYTYYPKQ